MADLSSFKPDGPSGSEYNFKDATTRAGIESSKTLKSSVITVTDAAPINAEDITVDITPVQDLHGYDRPWAGGAGKNKLEVTATTQTISGITFTVNEDGSIKANGTATAAIAFNLTNGFISFPSGTYIVSGTVSGNARIYVNPDGTRGYYDNGNGSAPFTVTSKLVARIQIETGAALNNAIFYPMIRLATETDATFAPYSNICPIEGRTGAGLDRVGKNLWSPNDTVVGFLNAGGSVESYIGFSTTNYRKCSANETYTLSYYRTDVGDGYGMRIAWYDADKNFIRRDGDLEERTVGLKQISATAPANAVYMRASMCTAIDYTENYQLELGTQPTAYEPYQGQQYTQSFGEAVYGGKWRVTKGGTDKTHANIANYNGETINEPWLSSLDEYSPGATPTIGAQVVYPLTTPTTISTPKQNVPMLKGINTVSADCGDTSLKYQPDNVIGELKGEIQKANSFVSKMALRQGSGAKDFSYGGWSFRLYIYRSMGQISMSVERISASSVTEQAVVKVFNDESDYRAPEELRPNFDLLQAATYTTPSGWALQVYLKDDGYIMFTGIAPEVGASAPTSSNWNLVEPWLVHQQAKDLFNN